MTNEKNYKLATLGVRAGQEPDPVTGAQAVPIYVIEYLAQKAREVNPDIIIMAKLSTRKDIEVDYVNRVGINLLILVLDYFHSQVVFYY